MRLLLGSWGCSVQVAEDGAALAELAQAPAPDLILLDLQLGQDHGLTLLAQLTAHWPERPPVIVISGQSDRAARAQVAEAGHGFLAKPIAPAALRAVVTQRLMATGRLQ
jgi:histidine kinase